MLKVIGVKVRWSVFSEWKFWVAHGHSELSCNLGHTWGTVRRLHDYKRYNALQYLLVYCSLILIHCFHWKQDIKFNSVKYNLCCDLVCAHCQGLGAVEIDCFTEQMMHCWFNLFAIYLVDKLPYCFSIWVCGILCHCFLVAYLLC